jgi:UDP-N-acetylglucosamine acyltransferase
LFCSDAGLAFWLGKHRSCRIFCGVIHPTAIVHPKAELDATVQVGPYAVIDEGVKIGPGCVIGPYVHLTGLTTIGAGNRFYAGCVVGEAPQDLKYKGEPTRLVIGDKNIIREHATVNRSTNLGEATVVGSQNLLMACSHVAHDCRLGDHVILANGALLAGHAIVDDHARISGNCLVHQFVRVGTLTIMQGGAAISKDLPPYTIARGYNGICGLNTVGLRRAGLGQAERTELKQLYRALFREGTNLRAAATEAREKFTSAPARVLLDFVAAAKRGVCADAGSGNDLEEEQED